MTSAWDGGGSVHLFNGVIALASIVLFKSNAIVDGLSWLMKY